MHTVEYTIKVNDVINAFDRAWSSQVDRESFCSMVSRAIETNINNDYFSSWCEDRAMAAQDTDQALADHYWQSRDQHVHKLITATIDSFYRVMLSLGQWFDDSFFVNGWGLYPN